MRIGNVPRSLLLGLAFTLASGIHAYAEAHDPCAADISNPQTLAAEDAKYPAVFEPFESLPRQWQDLLNANSLVRNHEGLRGRELYEDLTPRCRAGLLNIMAKASSVILPDGTTVLSHYRQIYDIHPDRFFAIVDDKLNDDVEAGVNHRLFFRREKAARCMHGVPKMALMRGWPTEMFKKVNAYKTHDAHGNLDMTLSKSRSTWTVEADTDEAQGIEHFVTEVVPHLLRHTLTDPLHIKRILEAQDIDTHYQMRSDAVPPPTLLAHNVQP